MTWFGDIFVFVILVLLALMFFASIVDDEEKKKGIQKRKYYNGKAGLRYKAPGDNEKKILGITVAVLWIMLILGYIISNLL